MFEIIVMFDFNSLKSVVGSSSYLGVDIGTASIKIAEIGRTAAKPLFKNYGILESYGHLQRINNVIQTSTLKISERETAELLKKLIEQSKFESREAIVSLPSFSNFITLLEIPQMTEKETTKTMEFQIHQYIPMPVEDVKMEWMKVGERQDAQGFINQEILLISVPNETIEKYKRIFENAGLKLTALELESLGMIRALALNDPAINLLVDIGARSTNIAVAAGGDLKYNFQTDFASVNLTWAVSQGLEINPLRAEKMKKEKGLLSGGASEISTLMMPYLDAIIKEVDRAKNKCEEQLGSKIEKIILSGGGAKLLGINDYFSKYFQLPAITGDPFSGLSYAPEIEPLVRNLGPSFSVAVGMGIKGTII